MSSRPFPTGGAALAPRVLDLVDGAYGPVCSLTVTVDAELIDAAPNLQVVGDDNVVPVR